MWVKPSGQTLLPLYLLSSLLLTSTQVVQFDCIYSTCTVVAALGIFILEMKMPTSEINKWLRRHLAQVLSARLAQAKESTASKPA